MQRSRLNQDHRDMKNHVLRVKNSQDRHLETPSLLLALMHHNDIKLACFEHTVHFKTRL